METVFDSNERLKFFDKSASEKVEGGRCVEGRRPGRGIFITTSRAQSMTGGGGGETFEKPASHWPVSPGHVTPPCYVWRAPSGVGALVGRHYCSHCPAASVSVHHGMVLIFIIFFLFFMHRINLSGRF